MRLACLIEEKDELLDKDSMFMYRWFPLAVQELIGYEVVNTSTILSQKVPFTRLVSVKKPPRWYGCKERQAGAVE